ncbi:cytochrome P450 [Amylostereum chailletii]|nr:cytochrome P450 [Amylostereum chailletii]
MASISGLLLLDCVAALVFILTLTLYFIFHTANSRLPPGPPSLPVVGNLFNVPTQEPWKVYARWSKKYGDLMSVCILGKTTVIVNSVKAVKDLFERRGAVYSERPVVPIFESDMMALHDWSYGMFPTNHRWRRGRKISEQAMRPEAVQNYWPILEVKAHQFLSKVLQSPTSFRELIRYSAGSTILLLLYGYDAESLDDDFLSLAEDFMDAVNKVILPGAVLVNVFPLLKYLPSWLPGMGFKTSAARCKEVGYRARQRGYDYVKERMAEGTARPSFVRDLLESSQEADDDNPLMNDDQTIIDSVGTLYGPGADTTVSALSVFFLALSLNPKVQDKAQEELDRVVGDGRLPTFHDRAFLPYVEAVYKETLRWMPPVPLWRHLSDSSVWIVIASVLYSLRIASAKDEICQETAGRFTDTIVSHPEAFNCTIMPRNEHVKNS